MGSKSNVCFGSTFVWKTLSKTLQQLASSSLALSRLAVNNNKVERVAVASKKPEDTYGTILF